jgi:double-stranded uracil-DNA glycosylase
MLTVFKPTRQDLLAAEGKKVADVIAANLRVLFCGINPGLYSAAVGHHFARPGNRFWAALQGAGFTDRVLSPFEEKALLKNSFGITNLVARATASAAELSAAELIAGARRLKRKARRLRARCIAFLGITAYRTAFSMPQAKLGKQKGRIACSEIWVLPNPSGLNAHHQLADLVRLFRRLRRAVL